jgi:hypothetical protein
MMTSIKPGPPRAHASSLRPLTCLILILAVTFPGCTSGTETDITGRWKMYKVLQEGKDVSAEHNPYNERYLLLKSDSTFETGGRPYGKNTGKYLYQAEDHRLFLDSDAGSEDDSRWMVTFREDTMFWKGLGSQWAEDFEIIQIRD